MQRVITNLFVSSANSYDLRSNGSRFQISLSTPINFHRKDVYCKLVGFSCFYDFKNIKQMLENTSMTFLYGGMSYVLFFETGLYSLGAIQDRLNELLVNNGLALEITLKGDSATGKISLKADIKGLSFYIDFDTNNNLFKKYLGFTGIISDPDLSFYESTNKARLNISNRLYVYASFVTGNIFQNQVGSQVCGVVPINVEPGSQIIFFPNIPTISKVSDRNLDNLYFFLLDENGLEVETDEPITLTFEFFEYIMPSIS